MELEKLQAEAYRSIKTMANLQAAYKSESDRYSDIEKRIGELNDKPAEADGDATVESPVEA